MASLLLTDAERVRFIEWLELSAESNEGVAAQMEKIGGAAWEAVARLNRVEAAAMRVVAKKLRQTESMSIGGTSNG